jgi:hypothetical protein
MPDYGSWLGDLARWDLWFTGTFQYDATMGTARRAAVSLTEEFDPFTAAYAIESRDRWSSEHRGSNVHVHALIEMGKGESNLYPSDLESWWQARFGWGDVERFDPDEGAGHYVAKYATKELHRERSSWDLYRAGELQGKSLPF